MEKCIQQTSEFGRTVYQDICNGGSRIVPMGGVDWLTLIILSALGIASVLATFMAVVSMINDIKKNNY